MLWEGRKHGIVEERVRSSGHRAKGTQWNLSRYGHVEMLESLELRSICCGRLILSKCIGVSLCLTLALSSLGVRRHGTEERVVESLRRLLWCLMRCGSLANHGNAASRASLLMFKPFTETAQV